MLYIVATPIGNMSDLSERAIKTLREVDLIVAEDTRVSGLMLSRLEIKKPLVSLHQHSDQRKIQEVVERMKQGESVAVVTDAGTPTISDPGGILVAEAVKAEVPVSPIPGPSAAITALSVSGFPADRFTFVGFPPAKKRRQAFFDEVAQIESTVVIYESKHRIIKTLEALPQDRHAMLARELTKLHETFYRGTVAEITEKLAKDTNKGEFVLVLAPTFWK